ncbi:hypothetical protein PGT21_009595 [Puccinia graminis f. sp. tritici]|uniref:Protein kinase domain-containing protein n=1 Tax=Puccinia graminis f. sp. tritici TaxID=56615 RepID=A0A5B0MKN8_PUCGR|nr:hypothetical protein PGT21_009595 [Puccinia graminis f. sp. tritici]
MKFPLRTSWLIVLAVHLIKAGFIPPNTSRVQLEGFGKTKIIPENSSAGSSLKLSHDERVHWGNIDRPSCDLSLKPWNVGTVADDHPAGPPLSDCETDAAATNGGSPDLNQTIRPVFPLKSAGVREIEFMGWNTDPRSQESMVRSSRISHNGFPGEELELDLSLSLGPSKGRPKRKKVSHPNIKDFGGWISEDERHHKINAIRMIDFGLSVNNHHPLSNKEDARENLWISLDDTSQANTG